MRPTTGAGRGPPRLGTPSGDRQALGRFFDATHKTDQDWSSEAVQGSGRQGWLDDELEINAWQGVTCEPLEPKGPFAGRVSKLCLPRNRIFGPITPLSPLTNVRKLSLWQNGLEGTLDALSAMTLLRELDLVRHRQRLDLVSRPPPPPPQGPLPPGPPEPEPPPPGPSR